MEMEMQKKKITREKKKIEMESKRKTIACTVKLSYESKKTNAVAISLVSRKIPDITEIFSLLKKSHWLKE